MEVIKVLELLSEIENEVDSASTVPLTGKVMIDPNVLLQITKDVKDGLPKSISDAQWVLSEQKNILENAKAEYDKVINEAQRRAEELVDENAILLEVKKRSEALKEESRIYSRELRLQSCEYVNNFFYNVQEKMDMLKEDYVMEMYAYLDELFEKVNLEIESNRREIRTLAEGIMNSPDFNDEEK